MTVFDLIKKHEGFSRGPYRCTANKLTIGYGRNLEANGISEEEAAVLLKNDVVEAEKHLEQEPYWYSLSDVRQAVLIDMVYNLGWSGFQTFKKLRRALEDKDYTWAASCMAASLWYSQVGNRSKRLVGMMQHDVWPLSEIIKTKPLRLPLR